MNKEQLQKTMDLVKEYNDDLFSKMRSINRIQSGKSKTKKQVPIESIEDVLILTSILLSGNIKLRYDVEEFIKTNRAFANLTQLKTLATNSKQDLEALKSISFNMTELAKIIRQKEENDSYKKEAL